MSAACVAMPQILPRVWATASVASAARAVEQRKSPHRLRLVEAKEELPWQMPKTVRAVEPGLAFYRKYTEGMLHRYATMSMEQGRVPSLLGRELFRGKVTSYKVHAFDDVAIFVHDMGNCLAELEPGLGCLVRRIALEGYTQEETAELLGLCLRIVVKRYGEALDKLTRLLLDRELLLPMPGCAEER